MRWRKVRGADIARGAFLRLISERSPHHKEPSLAKTRGIGMSNERKNDMM